MKLGTFRIYFALCLVFFTFTLSASAQGIGTVEYEIRYGREYLDARKYDMAIIYFENAVKKDPEHAEANYLIGFSYFKLGKPEKGRTFLEKAARLDSVYKKDVEAFLAQIDGAAEKEIETPRKRTSKDAQTGEELAEYEVGDTVEVFYAGDWNPGKIIGVEGRGASVRAEVEYVFQGEKRTAKFSYNALRHAAASNTKVVKTSKSASGLTVGEYGCSSKIWSGGQWVFTPRGSFRLTANGKYTQTNGSGSYKYNAEKEEITFTGGFFGNSGAKGKVISSSQIDIEFEESYWWTCALQE